MWTLLSSCLWIGGPEHDQRKNDLQPGFELIDLVPDTWSDCSGPPTFRVVSRVSARHAGESFAVWHEVDGVRTSDGQAVASQNANLQFDVSPASPGPACGPSCTLDFDVGVSRGGLDDGVPVSTVIFPRSLPTVARVDAIDALGQRVPFEAGPAVSVSQVSGLSVALADPYLASGQVQQELTFSVVACPVGQTAGCVTEVAGVFEGEGEGEGDGGGDAIVEVSTAAFAEAACTEGGLADLWEVSVEVLGHPCEPALVLDLGLGPLRFIVDDCDADGFTLEAGDCDDVDPERHPDADEIWYDGIDQDCDGAWDYDQDADGIDGGTAGTDCDDEDPTTYPGAPEICDVADNNCSGDRLEGVVTVQNPAGTVVEHPDLTTALGAAVPGDLVQICPGEHVGTFVVDDDLTLVGSGATESVLRPAGVGQPVLDVVGPVRVFVEGLEITGGSGVGAGAGIRAPDAETFTGIDLHVHDNHATDGGGIHVGGDVSLTDCVIEANTGTGAGGGLSLTARTTVSLIDTAIQLNSASEGGGAVLRDGATLSLDDLSLIEGNDATFGGGLLLLDDSTLIGGVIRANTAIEGAGLSARADTELFCAPTVTDTVIEDHQDPDTVRGGGIHAVDPGMLLALDGVVVARNLAQDGGGLYFAQGIQAELTGTEWRDNEATASGGGIYALGGIVVSQDTQIEGNLGTSGAGLFADGVEFLHVTGNVLGNTAVGDGGGLGLLDTFLFNTPQYGVGLEVTSNTADRGGAAYVDGSWFVVEEAILTDNQSTGAGGALYLTGAGSHVGLYGAGVIANNTSGDGASDGAFMASGDDLVSCLTVAFTDTVGCTGDLAAGVPANACFTLDPVALVEGVCDSCP